MNLHSGDFTCKANLRGREETFMSSLNVLKETTFVPMPIIDQVIQHLQDNNETICLIQSHSQDAVANMGMLSFLPYASLVQLSSVVNWYCVSLTMFHS